MGGVLVGSAVGSAVGLVEGMMVVLYVGLEVLLSSSPVDATWEVSSVVKVVLSFEESTEHIPINRNIETKITMLIRHPFFIINSFLYSI